MAKYYVLKSKREVDIPDDIIEFFEQNYEKVTDRKLSYLAVAEDLNDNSDKADLERGIIQGMIEEMELYVDTTKIIEMAHEKGYDL